ncbi:MFS transporter [Novosphingobium terrae]|uniref:MFS transporter n=1 Tax=Novosphingobium terrae TaxID=2726189 RepID=UPI00197FF040|nr:MFS transporter [Novosphingobium terrae]
MHEPISSDDFVHQRDQAVAKLTNGPISTAERPTRRRFVMLSLIAGTTLINYLDRTIIGVAAPLMIKDLGIGMAEMGLVFSAFAWTYVVAQLPGGALLDRIGSRLTYFLSITIWSLLTGLQGLCSGVVSLVAVRFGLGIAEAPCFPGASRMVSAWFPQNERARATGIYTVGEHVGLALVSPLLYLMMPVLGWRIPFLILSAIGVVFGIVWYRMYRDPSDCRKVNQAELDHIRAGGGITHKASRPHYDWATIRRLLSFRQVWGAGLGQFAGNAALVFFLTWFPTYLSKERHINFKDLAYFATLPYVAAAIGVMIGGYVSDYLIRKTGSVNLGRKLPIITGLLLISCMAAANYVKSTEAVVAIMAVAFFGQGLVGIGWTVISDIAPDGYQGLTGGLFNVVSNASGIIAPLAIGFILAATGSFTLALVMMSAIGLVGALAYIFVLGDIKRLTL